MKGRLARILAEEGLSRSASSMSVEDYFDVWKATDGMWYALVMDDKNYNPDDEDSNWGSSAEPEFVVVGREGPEATEADIMKELHRRHSNRAYQVDRSGRRAPGKPRGQNRWNLFADKEAGIVSPAARDVLETLSQLGPTELVSSVGDSLEFSVMVGPEKRVIITGVVDFDVFKYKVTYSTTVRGVIEVTSDSRTQRAEAQDIMRLIKN